MSAKSTDDKVGILLVHGMGNHQRGDFLRQIGEPLYHWVTSWLGRGDPNAHRRPLQSRSSSFRVPHRRKTDAPAHSVVETAFIDESGNGRRVTWVTADGWWANEIVPPSFSQVASWGLGLAPWMIVRHFRPRWRGILLVPSLVLVVLFQIVILALTTLGAIPKLRNYIVSLQLTITGSLGDVMVMASSPLQFSAMTTRLVDDLRWLQSQVPNGRIAVIAHSQGTGVAHAALQESRVPVDLFVTFGAALEKLHIARQVQQNRRRLALGSTLTTAGVVLLAIAAGTWLKGDPFSGNPDSAYIAARVLIAVGAVMLLARMGLWFHLGRLGGGLLTLFGVIALITGIPLASGAKPLVDHPWYEAPLRIHRLAWSDMVPDKWHGAALVAFTVGLILVIARELVFLGRRDRIEVEDPGSRPLTRGIRGIWGLRALLDPLSGFGNFAAAGAVIFGIFCIAMSTTLNRPPEDDAIVLLITAGLAFCFAAVPIPVGGVAEPTPDDFRIPRRESRMAWHNYWASADLVPDGDLPVGAHCYVHNHEITNRGSVLADHTSYHENTEEFLADVVGNVSRLAGWPLIRQDEVSIFERASHRRRWRVRFLSIAGWMSVTGMMTTWWVLGRAGMEPLGQPLESLLGNVIGVFPGVSAETIKEWLPAWRLGGLVIALITLFWYRIMLFQAWRYWDQVEASFIFHREPPDNAAGGLRFERAFAYSVFALSSAIGLCAAVWSPNLLRLTAERLKLIESPAVCVDCEKEWMLRWPGDRVELAGFGIWEWPWWGIGVTVLGITVVESLLIFSTVRRSSSSSDTGAVINSETVLAPAGRS